MSREGQLQELVEKELLRRMSGRLPARMTPKLRRELAAIMTEVLEGAVDEAVRVRVLCLVTGDAGAVRIRAAVERTPTRSPGKRGATVLPFPTRAAKAGA